MNPLEVLRDREGAVVFAAVGDGPYVDEYRAALAQVETLVEAALDLRCCAECDDGPARWDRFDNALAPFQDDSE